ncbi:hypothetical protein C0991_012415 [Blastosporella zonata]|nr:hypothetical protein C0991_012415 [Blastosporella zonata]
MADGILTPAVSVTSAVGGIVVAKQSVSKDIVPISIVCSKISRCDASIQCGIPGDSFGPVRRTKVWHIVDWIFFLPNTPVAFVWFLLLAGTGIYNITFFPGIFRAFDPSRAVLLFVRTKDYDLLAGILLALTGCEAVFAKYVTVLHSQRAVLTTCSFQPWAVQCVFDTGFVLPSLILAYLGQGARLIVDGDAVISNVFYQTIPGPKNGPLFWIVFVFAILATIIASQAMITATFSLTQQLINTKCFPPIRMIYTSETIQGQIYIPAVNWLLMIACIIFVGAFANLANLTNAYGFAVATVMFSTSVLIATQIYYVKGLPLILGLGYFLVFGFFDGLFWGAALKKVPKGAWVPLMIGLLLLLLMLLWTWAKALEDKFDGANRQNLRHFIQKDDKKVEAEDTDTDMDSTLYYVPAGVPELNSDSRALVLGERRELQRIPTCAIFHKMSEGKGVPHTFIGLIRQWPAIPRVVIFLSVCVVSVARVPKEERYVVSKVRSVEGFYGVTYYVGFRDDFNVQITDLVDTICDLERSSNTTGSAAIIEEIRAISQTATHMFVASTSCCYVV